MAARGRRRGRNDLSSDDGQAFYPATQPRANHPPSTRVTRGARAAAEAAGSSVALTRPRDSITFTYYLENTRWRFAIRRNQATWHEFCVVPTNPESFKATLLAARGQVVQALATAVETIEDAQEGKSAGRRQLLPPLKRLLATDLSLDFTWLNEEDRIAAEEIKELVLQISVVYPTVPDERYFDNDWFGVAEPNVDPPQSSELLDVIRLNASRIIVHFSPHTIEAHGIDDIALPMSAYSTTGYVPSTINSHSGILVKFDHMDKRKSNYIDRLEGSPTLKTGLLGCFTPQALVEAAVTQINDPTSKASTFLESRVVNQAAPVFRPYVSAFDGKYKVHFFAGDYRGILCDTEDEAQEKVDAAMALVRVQTLVNGRTWADSTQGRDAMREVWLRGNRPPRGQRVSAQRAEILAGEGCIGEGCQEGSHLCGCYPRLHPLNARIPCAEMCGWRCRAHLLHVVAGNLRSLLQHTNTVKRNQICIPAYDARRGIQTNPDTIPALYATAATALPGANASEWNYVAIETVIRSDDAAVLQLARSHPLLDDESLQHRPTALKQAPLAYDLARQIRSVTRSLDQFHMVDDQPGGSGAIVGHNSDTVRLAPAAFQHRKSSHPTVALLYWSCILITAAPIPAAEKRALLKERRAALEAMASVEQYLRSGTALPAALVPVSTAAHLLYEPSSASPAATLAALRPLTDRIKNVSPPIRSLKALNNTYYTGYKSAPDGLSDVEGWKDLIRTHEKDLKDIMAMSPRELKRQATRFNEMIKPLEAQFPGLKVPRNAEGMPHPLLPPNSETRDILIFNHVAWRRATTECDADKYKSCGVVTRPSGSYWVTTPVLAVHWLRNRRRDVPTQLILDDTGRTNLLTKLCAFAHIDHKALFFPLGFPREGTDILRFLDPSFTNIQTLNRFSNEGLQGMRIGSIVLFLKLLKPVVVSSYRLLREAEASRITDASLAILGDPNTPVMNDAQAAALQLNDREWWEC